MCVKVEYIICRFSEFLIIANEITKNQVIKTYQDWGPNYKVEFNIRVVNTQTASELNVINFIRTEEDVNNHILLASIKDEKLHISANFGHVWDFDYELGEEYNIIIQHSGM